MSNQKKVRFQQKLLKKTYSQGEDCYEAAIKRMHRVFDLFDTVVVAFSGGKDSTVVLNLARQVARERGRLPLKVVFFDGEAVPPPVVGYISRVSKNPDFDFHWFCLPFKHRNACSQRQPYWHCWNPDEKHLWVRQMPPGAITSHPNFKWGMTYQEFSAHAFEAKDTGTLCNLTGIRSQESLMRLTMMLKRKRDNYINQMPTRGFFFKAHPIYDWEADDVHYAIWKFGWDYSSVYDILDAFGYSIIRSRVGQPFGEESVRGLDTFKTCFPQMFEKIIRRVKGAEAAWRYSNTELYASVKEPPKGMSWQQYMKLRLENYPTDAQTKVVSVLNRVITRHYSKSTLNISEETPDPISGVSWKFLARIAAKGDFKGRTARGLTIQAENGRKASQISFLEAVDRFGTPEYKEHIGEHREKYKDI